MKGPVPLWPRCASEGGFHRHPFSPGVRICTCRERGGHRSQTHQLQTKKTASHHSVRIPGILSQGSYPGDGIKERQAKRTSEKLRCFQNDEVVKPGRSSIFRILSPAAINSQVPCHITLMAKYFLCV